jgi:phosphate starvation-inducible PhoH-like protein
MGKRRNRHRHKSQGITQEELNAIRKSEQREFNKKKTLQPRNVNQKHYDRLLADWSRSIVLALGPAGTGKTLFAVHHAIQSFNAGEINKIIITRPAVSVDESHGYLPGGLVDKMMPWIRPIHDIMTDYWSPQHVKWLMESELVEIAPLAYMRGRTFKDAWIIADEMQNGTPEQMKMLLTRIGERSRIVVTGDLAQHDRGYEQNGLQHFVERCRSGTSKNISLIEFEQGDIERHPVVSEVLGLYGEGTNVQQESETDWKILK